MTTTERRIINLIPANTMPVDWTPGDAAPWRNAIGYPWQRLVMEGYRAIREQCVPGDDRRYTGPESLDAVIAELRAEYGDITVVDISGDGWINSTDGLTMVARITGMWCGGLQVGICTGTPAVTEQQREAAAQAQRNAEERRDAEEILSCTRVFTDEAARRAWEREYNNAMNEGGEGYIPLSVTVAQQEYARTALERLNDENQAD